MKRRGFIKGALSASLAYRIFPSWATAQKPIMRLGAVSDVHMRTPTPIFPYYRGSEDNHLYFGKALKWFDRMQVDAVVVAGDIADRGLISEWEQFADTFNRVFPDRRGSDGRKVERIVVTGNHDIGQWPSLWKKVSEENQRKFRFDHPCNLRRMWSRLMGEEWSLISRKEVKGITFVYSQYMSLRPPVEKYFRDHADSLPQDKPFFYVQHAHPRGTCFGDSKRGLWDYDIDGQVGRSLAKFPRSIVLSGHTHNSIVDDRSVWQGGYTSINCGSTWGAGLVYYGRDNALADFFGKDYLAQRQKPIAPLENAGRCALAIDVHIDHLVVHRWCVQTDEPLGEPWVVPLPARKCGPFDFAQASESRRRKRLTPEFSPESAVRVEECERPPKNAGPRLKGKRVLRATFPSAKPVCGVRVFDYRVRVLRDGAEVASSIVLSPGFFLPLRLSDIDGEAMFGADELPHGVELKISVVPRDCYGTEGKELVSAGFKISGKDGSGAAA